MVAVTPRVVVGLIGIVVGESLKVVGDNPHQLLACRTFFGRHNRVENRVVRNEIFYANSWTIIEIDLDFLNFLVCHLESRADVDHFPARSLRCHVLDYISENRVGVDAFRENLRHSVPLAIGERDSFRVLSDVRTGCEWDLRWCVREHIRVELLRFREEADSVARSCVSEIDKDKRETRQQTIVKVLRSMINPLSGGPPQRLAAAKSILPDNASQLPISHAGLSDKSY